MQIDLEPHEWRRDDEASREPVWGPNAKFFLIMTVIAIPLTYVVRLAVAAILAPLW